MTTVFVTGAGSGFGAAFARRFTARRRRVVACARRADRLAALGPDVLPPVVDVRDRAAVVAVIKGLPASHAAIDILVNNVARQPPHVNVNTIELMPSLHLSSERREIRWILLAVA